MFSYISAQAGRGHKHSSNHGNRRNTSKHSKSTNLKPKSSSRTGVPQTVPHSFLFVVNELQVDFEPRQGEERGSTDQWFNTVPPQRAEAYTGETVGAVFRYQNGVVTPAPGYVWHRPGMGHPGGIARLNQANLIDGWPAHYKTHTVFACSPHLPVIVTDTDASLGYAAMHFPCGCDRAYDEQYSRWRLLHFDRDGGPGLSRINAYASGDTYAAGRDASWIPALIPRAYQNMSVGAEPSRGLSGELPILIALMAFHGRPGRASDVFFEQKWHMCRWRGSGASSYLPKAGDAPRGFVVQVCADNLVPGQEDNEVNNFPEDECREFLLHLEWATTLVQDTPRVPG